MAPEQQHQGCPVLFVCMRVCTYVCVHFYVCALTSTITHTGDCTDHSVLMRFVVPDSDLVAGNGIALSE